MHQTDVCGEHPGLRTLDALMIAVNSDRYPVVEDILSCESPESEVVSKDNLNGLLLMAAHRGNSDIMSILIKYGANIDETLQLAVKKGDKKQIGALLYARQELGDKSVEPLNQALLTATTLGCPEIVNLLIECGAENLNEALELALQAEYPNQHPIIVKILIASGAKPSSNTLKILIEKNLYYFFKILTSLNILVDEDSVNESVLLAAQKGYANYLKTLFDNWIKYILEDTLNEALSISVNTGYAECVSTIIYYSKTIKLETIERYLLLATQQDYVDIVKIFIKQLTVYWGSIDKIDNKIINKCLLIAVDNNSVLLAKILAPLASVKGIYDALQLAVNKNYSEIVTLLKAVDNSSLR